MMLSTLHTVSRHAIPDQVQQYGKADIMRFLMLYGNFDYHQAHAIYHAYVAELDYAKRVLFASKVYTGIIRENTKDGRALLKGCPGL